MPERPSGVTIRRATWDDASAVTAIRIDAIEHSLALWIEAPPTAEQNRAWIAGHLERGALLVAVEAGPEEAEAARSAGAVLGFASYDPLRPYSGYARTVEDSIYLTARAQGRGLGTTLLERLIQEATDAGMHSMVGNIEAGNTASITLHERLGFREVGRMPEAGWKAGRWLDLVIMQRML